MLEPNHERHAREVLSQLDEEGPSYQIVNMRRNHHITQQVINEAAKRGWAIKSTWLEPAYYDPPGYARGDAHYLYMVFLRVADVTEGW